MESIIKNVEWQMSLNRKSGPLKELQGIMWKSGYETGLLKGIVYDDVVVALEKFKLTNIPVSIYSSGSIAAQRLLFGYSNHGSLLHLFDQNFDTTIGSKLETKSYTKISRAMNLEPSEIMFLSDNINENARAKEAGMQTLNVLREGNEPIPDLFGIKQITSFDQLFKYI